jgi:hypothetical protein
MLRPTNNALALQIDAKATAARSVFAAAKFEVDEATDADLWRVWHSENPSAVFTYSPASGTWRRPDGQGFVGGAQSMARSIRAAAAEPRR